MKQGNGIRARGAGGPVERGGSQLGTCTEVSVLASEWFILILLSGLNLDLATTDHSSLHRCTFSNNKLAGAVDLWHAEAMPGRSADLAGPNCVILTW